MTLTLVAIFENIDDSKWTNIIILRFQSISCIMGAPKLRETRVFSFSEAPVLRSAHIILYNFIAYLAATRTSGCYERKLGIIVTSSTDCGMNTITGSRAVNFIFSSHLHWTVDDTHMSHPQTIWGRHFLHSALDTVAFSWSYFLCQTVCADFRWPSRFLRPCSIDSFYNYKSTTGSDKGKFRCSSVKLKLKL